MSFAPSTLVRVLLPTALGIPPISRAAAAALMSGLRMSAVACASGLCITSSAFVFALSLVAAARTFSLSTAVAAALVHILIRAMREGISIIFIN